MMMASSSSSSTSSRDGQTAPQLTRQNSSFLGAIKTIVTAPFSWFGNADVGADVAGSKRRRPQSGPTPMTASSIQQEPTEIIEEQRSSSDEDEEDEAARRSKRMRFHSPARTTKATTAMRRSSVVPRASSAVLPSSRGASRATVSPKRNTQLYPPTIHRTMSIDPPQLTSRRDPPSTSFNFGVDVDMVGLDARDISMPPSSPSRLSPRPSFRMRASMTPQPVQHTLPQRHISEPPPLNALFSNPVFVHPPLQQKDTTPIPAPPPTLGTLMESTRNVLLPVKHQRVSLLFNDPKEDEAQKDVPAERALQQLDIYKTPLLPSRMRPDADSITANVIPDIFKSHRVSRPLLTSDDREKSAKKPKGPVVNETKPYAGEGGMKKLLARAKLEAEKEKAMEKDDALEREEASEPFSVPLPPPPPPVTSDWFKSAVCGTSTSSSGSSLRVGRQKISRNHIQRPSKSRFSAAYEDEGDDAMEDDERVKERQMLEEAAKKVPVFNIPAGFSFAKDMPAPLPSADDLQKAKEPPIKSLPFSFSKPSSPSGLPNTDSVPKESQPTYTGPMSIFGSASTQSASTPSTGTTVPNFFATSQVLKQKSIPHFSVPTTASGTAPTGPNVFGTPSLTSASTAVLEKIVERNPFLEGKDEEAVASKPNIFAGSSAGSSSFLPTGNLETVVESPMSFMPSKDKGPTVPSSTSLQPGESKPAAAAFPFGKTTGERQPMPSPFSFGKAAADKSTSPATATTSGSGTSGLPLAFRKLTPAQEKPPASRSLPFSLVATSGTVEKKTEAVLAPKPLFEPSTSMSSSAPESTPSIFGNPPKAAAPASLPPPQPTPSPLSFSFDPLPSSGSPTLTRATTDTAKSAFSFGSSANTGSIPTPPVLPPDVESPKPLFAPFSFRQEKKQPEVKSSPFSFGATPSTPSASVESASFTFGSSSTSVPVPVASTPPIAFSFSGGGSAGTDVTTKAPFIFGVPSSVAAHPERPVTPPRTQDQEVRMEESPVREMQVNGKTLEAPPAPFSFGGGTLQNGTNGSGGSTTAPSTGPFAFGPSSATSNLFKKPEESKPFGFNSPQAPPINTSFSFSKDESRPTSSFTFGQTPTSATNPTPAFSFGPPTNASPNPFAAVTNSAPGSPSTFAQPAPFTFGAPSATTSGFTFGSQPASPAGGANVTLPQPTISTSTTFGNGASFGQTPSPASPFTPLPVTQSTSSGGALFTIGAAPAPLPGQRQIKKLPRRGNVKR